MRDGNAFLGLRLLLVACFFLEGTASGDELLDLAIIKKPARTQMANAGWAYDRYQNLETLDAGKTMVVADLAGPGVIRSFHTTRHHPAELAARGVVLEIWFDDAKEAAVICPLADFFGDGCNGSSKYFTSNFIECAPWSYNCFIPMPFESRARVSLRNDTEVNIANYSFVEWESLPEWNPDLGYFHATYDRRCFQLTEDTVETFLEIEGAGHLLGRQYSIVTQEPLFRHFAWVMEGNNEVDVDGTARHFDYLGTEDSFGFSWGFQNSFAGLRAGMALVETEGPARLSIYRFHDHMPIRFERSLRWSINWAHEQGMQGRADLAAAARAGGCWVDYATVHYWYQDSPGGFTHDPLLPLAERIRPILNGPGAGAELEKLFESLPTDGELVNQFSSRDDLARVAVVDAYKDTHPFWIDQPAASGGHPGNPNPGRQGILAVHPEDGGTPCVVVRKVALPPRSRCKLRVVVSGDPFEAPGRSDFLLRAGIHVDGRTHWFQKETVDAGTPPSAGNWRTFQYDLRRYAGKTVAIAVMVSYGGEKAFGMNEEAFFDEISVVSE